MWDALLDHLSTDNWEPVVEPANRPSGFKEYHVTRQHKQTGPNAYGYMIYEGEEDDPFPVKLEGTKKDTDPLKQVALAELILSKDGTRIEAIDLDGDIVKLKGKK